MAGLVQQAQGNAISGTTVAASLTGVASGNLLVVCIRQGYEGVSITSVEDSVNGAYSLARSRTDTTRGTAAIYYYPNSGAGNPTVTVTYSGSIFNTDINLSEWSGMGTGTVDTANDNQNSSGTAHSGGSITPSASALIISAAALNGTHGGATPAAGFSVLTVHGSAHSQRQYYQYKLAHTGATTGEWTSTTSRTSNMVIAAFLESGASVNDALLVIRQA